MDSELSKSTPLEVLGRENPVVPATPSVPLHRHLAEAQALLNC